MIDLMITPSITYMITTKTGKVYLAVVNKNTPVHILIERLGGKFLDKKWMGNESEREESYKVEAIDVGFFDIGKIISHRKSENKIINSDGSIEILSI